MIKFAAFLLIISPIYSFAQATFDELLEETNYLITDYERLSPWVAFYPLDSLHISPRHMDELEADSENLSDSVETMNLIYYYHEWIFENLTSLVAMDEFGQLEMTKAFASSLQVASSPDQNLVSFNLDEKTGGSYRSRMSLLIFRPSEFSDGYQILSEGPTDGYTAIHQLESTSGTKYLLMGEVMGCNTCFASYVDLVRIDSASLVYELNLHVIARSFNEGVSYDANTKILSINYHLNDLFQEVICPLNREEQQLYEHANTADYDTFYRCNCSYLWKGETFELIQSSFVQD